MLRAGFGCGFIRAIVAASDNNMVRLLPATRVPSLPIWLTVHREVRSSMRLRMVDDALAVELKRL